MSLFEASTINVVAWLVALAFIAAGIDNADGVAAIQARLDAEAIQPGGFSSQSRWKFAMPFSSFFPERTRIFGLALGAAVMIAATGTALWRREYKHVLPCVASTALVGVEVTFFAPYLINS